MSDPGKDFERLVVDFCKNNWDPEAVRENRFVEGREVDILVETSSELIIIECTIERNKKKAEQDITKIREVRRALVGDGTHRTVRGFFVTKHEPSPEIHAVAAANGSWISARSLPSFISAYCGGETYLNARKKRPFGSVRWGRQRVDGRLHPNRHTKWAR